MNPSTSADTAVFESAAGRGARRRPDRGDRRPPRPAGAAPKPKPAWAVAVEWVDPDRLPRSSIALLIKTFLFQAFYIPSDSMVPTLKTNDRVIVNKLSYQPAPGAPRRHHRVQVAARTSTRRSRTSSSASSGCRARRSRAAPTATSTSTASCSHEPYLPKGTQPGPELRRDQGPAGLVLGDGRQSLQLAGLALLPRALHPQEGHHRARVPADLAAQPPRYPLTAPRRTVN